MKEKLRVAAVIVFISGLFGAAHASPVDIMTGRMAIQLQQAGLDPVQARWGAWAVLHNPHNDCARYASMISAQADMPGGLGYDSSHSTESDVIYVEQHNLCTEANAKRVPQPPPKPHHHLSGPPVVVEVDPNTGQPIGLPVVMHPLGGK